MTRLLLLTYAFQPDNTPAAARPTQLCRYLPDHGIRTYVIASSVDRSFQSQEMVWRVPDGRGPLSATMAAGVARGFMRIAAPYNDRLPWVPHVIAAASRLIRSHCVDIVYSTSPFLASHFAAYWLKRKYGLPWIADFQDPICDNPFRTRKWLYPYDQVIERTIFGAADRIIANTDAIAAVWRARYETRREAISVMWNAFDPAEPAARSMRAAARSQRVIAHVGTLYGGRHPGRLLESLQRLGTQASDVCVKLIGPIDGTVLQSHGEAFEQLRQRGMLEIENSLVPRQQALEETANADCLLLLDVNERNTAFQVPSKLLDYIRTGKPILAYTPVASPVERILARSGVAFVSIPPDARPEMSDVKVQRFLELPLQGRRPSDWFFENFSAETQARHFAELVRGVVRHDPVEVHSGTVIAAVGNNAVRAAPRRWSDGHSEADASTRPLIVTTVDAEEEFDWKRPLSREYRDVRAMREQHILHRIFERSGVIPIYFVTHPIVTQPDGYEFLLDCLRDGKCQIGSQLHPWVTPPFDEAVSAYNSFAGNLPEALEFAKLRTLTDAIADRFSERPVAYRAGRYGIGPNTVHTLRSLGYRIDSSVVPEFSYRQAGGPAFFGKPNDPYWLGNDRYMLELPLTSSYVGRLTGAVPAWRNLADGLFQDDARHEIARSVMARCGLVERIRLTPEGTRVSDAKRLVRTLMKRGVRVFTLSYHSPSVVPGNTPYVRSNADRARFLAWFEAFYEFFLGDLGGMPVTVTQVYDLMHREHRNIEATPTAVSL